MLVSRDKTHCRYLLSYHDWSATNISGIEKYLNLNPLFRYKFADVAEELTASVFMGDDMLSKQ
jgi:hypothetical protein